MKKIQILGPGCAKCQKLYDAAKMAIDEMGMECVVEKVTDIQEIMKFGVMMTPALVVNSKVVFVGKVPSIKELKDILS